MLVINTTELVPFLKDNKLTKAHCTVIVDKDTKGIDYVVTDDSCIYQLHEEHPVEVKFDSDKDLVFAFQVPHVIHFAADGSCLSISTQVETNMAQLFCDKPRFSSIIKLNDNYSDKLEVPDVPFISMRPYADVIKAIKNMKSLATDLSTSINVELGDTFWTVSVSQCCTFGAAQGIKGTITSQLFEKIYDWDAKVSQVSSTSLLVRRDYQNGRYMLIHVPISKNVELPNLLLDMVPKTGIEIVTELTSDVSSIIGEIIKNIKRDSINVIFKNGRLDLRYVDNTVSLTTEVESINVGDKIDIRVPIKSLVSVVNILDKPAKVTTNGEYVCMMRDNRGLLISGIIS
jgi:hypothetical protein